MTCHALTPGERGKPASDLTRVRLTTPAPGGGKLAWPEFRAEEMADLSALLTSFSRTR